MGETPKQRSPVLIMGLRCFFEILWIIQDEYPEMVFTNQKAYRVNQVESQRDANELEVQLYSLLQAKQKLTKEIRQSLRDQYLVVETADQDDDEIEQTIE